MFLTEKYNFIDVMKFSRSKVRVSLISIKVFLMAASTILTTTLNAERTGQTMMYFRIVLLYHYIVKLAFTRVYNVFLFLL